MMMKQQSTYARLQNTYWTIYKYGRLLLYQLYGMRRQEVRLRFIFYLSKKQQINQETYHTNNACRHKIKSNLS